MSKSLPKQDQLMNKLVKKHNSKTVRNELYTLMDITSKNSRHIKRSSRKICERNIRKCVNTKKGYDKYRNVERINKYEFEYEYEYQIEKIMGVKYMFEIPIFNISELFNIVVYNITKYSTNIELLSWIAYNKNLKTNPLIRYRALIGCVNLVFGYNISKQRVIQKCIKHLMPQFYALLKHLQKINPSIKIQSTLPFEYRDGCIGFTNTNNQYYAQLFHLEPDEDEWLIDDIYHFNKCLIFKKQKSGSFYCISDPISFSNSMLTKIINAINNCD